MISQARVRGPNSVRKSIDTRNPDDTAIVQSMGAPFAALQWHQHDSINKYRYGGLGLDIDISIDIGIDI